MTHFNESKIVRDGSGRFAEKTFAEADDSVTFGWPYQGSTASQPERIEAMHAAAQALKDDPVQIRLQQDAGDHHFVESIDGISFEEATDAEGNAAAQLAFAYDDYVADGGDVTAFASEDAHGDVTLDARSLADAARRQRVSPAPVNEEVDELVTSGRRKTERRVRTAVARTEMKRAQQEDMRDIADGVRARYPDAASMTFVMHHDEDGPTLRPAEVRDAGGTTLASTMYGHGGDEMPDGMYEDIDDRIAEVNAQELMGHSALERTDEEPDAYSSHVYRLDFAQVDNTPIDQPIEKMHDGHKIDHVLASVPMSADYVQPQWNARTRNLDSVSATMRNGQTRTLTVDEYPQLQKILDERTGEALRRGEGAKAWR